MTDSDYAIVLIMAGALALLFARKDKALLCFICVAISALAVVGVLVN